MDSHISVCLFRGRLFPGIYFWYKQDSSEKQKHEQIYDWMMNGSICIGAWELSKYLKQMELLYKPKLYLVVLPWGFVISWWFDLWVEYQRLIHWTCFGKQIWWFARLTTAVIVLPPTTLQSLQYDSQDAIAYYTAIIPYQGRKSECYWLTTPCCDFKGHRPLIVGWLHHQFLSIIHWAYSFRYH